MPMTGMRMLELSALGDKDAVDELPGGGADGVRE